MDHNDQVLYEDEIKAGLGITVEPPKTATPAKQQQLTGKKFRPEPRPYSRIKDIKSSVLDRSHVQNNASRPDSLVRVLSASSYSECLKETCSKSKSK